jgi:hypothetical protein
VYSEKLVKTFSCDWCLRKIEDVESGCTVFKGADFSDDPRAQVDIAKGQHDPSTRPEYSATHVCQGCSDMFAHTAKLKPLSPPGGGDA